LWSTASELCSPFWGYFGEKKLTCTAIAVFVDGESAKWQGSLATFAVPSTSNVISSWCQYEALKYVPNRQLCLCVCFRMLRQQPPAQSGPRTRTHNEFLVGLP
jgi:hypothetical protein